MKILAVSDLHGKLEGFDPSGVDVVVIAGDLAPLSGFSKWHIHDQKKWIQKKFMEFARRYPETDFVVVPGNHDLCLDPAKTRIHPDLDYKIEWANNVRLLIDSAAFVKGMTFYGTPWVPIISRHWAFEADREKQIKMFSKIPNEVDVLISHTPPHISNSFLDRSTQYGISEAFGSDVLASMIFDKKPNHVFCGHIHTGEHSEVNFNGTKIYNVSRLNEDYDIAYDPVCVEIP